MLKNESAAKAKKTVWGSTFSQRMQRAKDKIKAEHVMHIKNLRKKRRLVKKVNLKQDKTLPARQEHYAKTIERLEALHARDKTIIKSLTDSLPTKRSRSETATVSETALSAMMHPRRTWNNVMPEALFIGPRQHLSYFNWDTGMHEYPSDEEVHPAFRPHVAPRRLGLGKHYTYEN